MNYLSKHHYKITAVVLIALVNFVFAENILKILEGYGRDSIATFSTRNAHAEAARLFNLILEPNGDVAVEKAEQYLTSQSSPAIKAYLSVMLADYAFVNHNDDSGLRYLKRAVEDYDDIRNDSYYRLVLSRAQHNIVESPGKSTGNKDSVLKDFSPSVIKETPPPATVKVEVKVPAAPETPTLIAVPEKSVEKPVNFRIQIGAFSVKDNAERKKEYFKERSFPVQIETRERTSGYLYIVRIGEYATYDEAKLALSDFKQKYPAEDGIVIKVEK